MPGAPLPSSAASSWRSSRLLISPNSPSSGSSGCVRGTWGIKRRKWPQWLTTEPKSQSVSQPNDGGFYWIVFVFFCFVFLGTKLKSPQRYSSSYILSEYNWQIISLSGASCRRFCVFWFFFHMYSPQHPPDIYLNCLAVLDVKKKMVKVTGVDKGAWELLYMYVVRQSHLSQTRKMWTFF